MVDWLALGVAAAASAAAWLAVARAGESNRVAQSALKEAQRANKLAREANAISSESNRIAIDGNKLAEEANLIARSNEARAIERNDVDWDFRWENYGLLQLTNCGNDPAHDVIVRADCNGHHAETSGDVMPGEYLVLDLHGVADECADYLRGVEAAERRRLQRPTTHFMPVKPLVSVGHVDPGVWLTAVVTWSSPSGTQHREQIQLTFSSQEPLG